MFSKRISGNFLSLGLLDYFFFFLSLELFLSWKVVEGEFIFGCFVFLSYLGIDLMVNLDGKFGDGLMGIFYVRLIIG